MSDARMRRRAAAFTLFATAGCVAAPPLPGPPPPTTTVEIVPAALRPIRLFAAPVQGGLAFGEAPAGTTLTLEAPGEVPGAAPIAIATDAGRFVIGFDRDAAAVASLIARAPDGRSVRLDVRVAPRAWRIERVDAPLRAGRSDAAFDAARPAELAAIAAARANSAPQLLGPTTPAGFAFAWPAIGRIAGLFGAQRVYRGVPGSFHNGIDIAVPAGTPVRAPLGGRVVLATDHPFTLEGNLVIVDHGDGVSSAFLHLSRIDVRAGQRVAPGQVLGAVGATGRATGPHLHWGLRWRDTRLDPLLAAGPMPTP